MPTGTVKWFNNAKGYGFILPDNGDADVFAHYSAIDMEGYRTLKAGQQVSFETVDGDKGKQAANIHLVEESNASQPEAEQQPALA
jgi:CspA family cold shock protein